MALWVIKLKRMFDNIVTKTNIAETLLASWAPTTKRQSALVLRRWQDHWVAKSIDPQRPTLMQGIEDLQKLFDEGSAGASINTVRSLLSSFQTIDNKPFGEHPLVARVIRGINNLRPTTPKYRQTVTNVKRLGTDSRARHR
jgi:hypothetical protein